MKPQLSPGTLFFTNTFGSANEFGIVLPSDRELPRNVYRVLLRSGRVGELERIYLLVGEEMDDLR